MSILQTYHGTEQYSILEYKAECQGIFINNRFFSANIFIECLKLIIQLMEVIGNLIFLSLRKAIFEFLLVLMDTKISESL